ncbi:MAG: DNA repair protein RecN [Methylococcaceae bacterium]
MIQLSIQDLALVEKLELTLESGFAVLTGETGAGKSILLNALGFGLGEKADAGQIRPGATRAEVSLHFDLSDAEAAKLWLDEQELAEADECLIRRVISAEGRSRAYVNSRPVTLTALQSLGARLIEIHGQHAHVHLLKPAEQRRLLDEAAGHAAVLDKAAQLADAWRTTKKELEHLTTVAREGTAREEMLRFQIEELEQHDVEQMNYPALVEAHTRMANVGRILEIGQAQLDALYEEEQLSIASRLAQSTQALTELAHIAPEFEESVLLLKEAQVQVSEAATTLRRRLERLDADPTLFGRLEQTLADVHHLARKHHIRPETLAEQLRTLREELDGIAHHSERVERLKTELGAIQAEYEQVSATLTANRTAAATLMAERISSCIRELGMPQGNFLIKVATDLKREPVAHGNDTVEFMVSANPGLPPRPLAKVASGGELSRISLAIQVTASDSKTVPTLIFDEVDTGVGGRVAEMVGLRLRALGQDRQVLCVTHLPQVAALGHHHLLVEKKIVDSMTRSSVHRLDPDERVAEIARMLGGLRITPQTLAHAREMLDTQALSV